MSSWSTSQSANFDDTFESTLRATPSSRKSVSFASQSTATLSNKRKRTQQSNSAFPTSAPYHNIQEAFAASSTANITQRHNNSTASSRQHDEKPDRVRSLVQRLHGNKQQQQQQPMASSKSRFGEENEYETSEDYYDEQPATIPMIDLQTATPSNKKKQETTFTVPDHDDELEEGFLGGGAFGDSNYVYKPMNPFETETTPTIQEVAERQKQLQPLPATTSAATTTTAATTTNDEDTSQSVSNVQMGLYTVPTNNNNIPTFMQQPQAATFPSAASAYSTSTSYNNNDVLIKKMDYMIHLLEQQQESKSSSIWEDVILYGFIGLFLIFLCDCAFRYAAMIGITSCIQQQQQQQRLTYSSIPHHSSTAANASYSLPKSQQQQPFNDNNYAPESNVAYSAIPSVYQQHR